VIGWDGRRYCLQPLFFGHATQLRRYPGNLVSACPRVRATPQRPKRNTGRSIVSAAPAFLRTDNLWRY